MNSIRIEPAANGYVVTYDDPDIRDRNRKSDGPWEDPEVMVVAESEESVATILAKLLPELKQKDPGTQFAEAFKEATEDK